MRSPAQINENNIDFSKANTANEMGLNHRLSENIVHFARLLRTTGIKIGPSKVIDAQYAMNHIHFASKSEVYWTLHSIFISKHEHSPIFDTAFAIFWRRRNIEEKLLALLSPEAPPARAEPPKTAERRLREALAEIEMRQRPEMPEIEVDAHQTTSSQEILQQKDFAQMSQEEINEAQKAIALLSTKLQKITSRRFHFHHNGKKIDLRRTLKKSMTQGGEIIKLERVSPIQVEAPIVALCDISGSMNQYSRIFLHFLHALSQSHANIHSFVFGTRLTNITRQLRHKDVDEALNDCSAIVEDWSGGTRIGQALHDFNKNWSRRVLSGRPTLLFMSDGLERDKIDQLSFESERLAKSVRKFIWLNPLLRYDGFEAKAAGIKAILPHVTTLCPIHNLKTMKELCAAISTR